jgi:LacI family transcriptional regulator
MKKTDINAVAQACKVSKTTVSKVFTRKEGISAATRRKVLKTARQLNYTPKQVMAQETVVIVVNERTFLEGASFRAMLLASVMNKLTDSGYLLKIVTTEEVSFLLQSYTKLAIMMANGQVASQSAAKLQEAGIPVITANCVIDGCYSICCDHAQAVELAVDHLVDNGHQRIALMLDDASNWAGKERIQGYEKAMGRHGLKPMPCRSRSESMTVVECLRQIQDDTATALIIQGESIIHEAVYMLNVLRLKVPGDLSIVSSEIALRSRWFTPPHTTTNQNLDEMACKIADTVVGILAGTLNEPVVTMLPSELVERNSVSRITEAE